MYYIYIYNAILINDLSHQLSIIVISTIQFRSVSADFIWLLEWLKCCLSYLEGSCNKFQVIAISFSFWSTYKDDYEIGWPYWWFSNFSFHLQSYALNSIPSDGKLHLSQHLRMKIINGVKVQFFLGYNTLVIKKSIYSS